MTTPDDPMVSRAEELFAELFARSAVDTGRALDELCAAHPELTEHLRGLERQRERLFGAELALREGALFGAPDSPGPVPIVEGFRLLAFLGRGGMGEVWEAEDLDLARHVAIKLLPVGSAEAYRATSRFRREAQAAARLRHPGVVSVLSTGESDGRRYIVQELVPSGRSLYDVLEEVRRAGELPASWEAEVARIFAALADALAAAHAAGIVHRDVKPHNVLLTPEGAPKLADFGLAWFEGSEALSRTGEFVGTWIYASPEQLAPDAQGVGPQSDVFSLGVSLYECLTLRRPFEGDTLHEITHAISRVEPPSAAEVRPRVPRDLAVICAKAMEKSRAARYPTMAELRDDLRRFLAHEPIHARPLGPVGKARRWARRRPAPATALAALVLALPVLGLALWRTRAALDEAVDARAVEAQVVAMLDELFYGADPWNLGRSEPSVRDLVERGVKRVHAGEPSLPAARARVLATLGGVLSSLGDSQAALELLAEGAQLYAELGLEDDPAARSLRAEQANALVQLGRGEEACALAEPLVELWTAGRLPPEDAYPAHLALGLAHIQAGRLDDARDVLEHAVDVAAELIRPQGFEAAQARTMLAEVDWNAGRHAEGLARLEADAVWLRPLLASGNGVALQSFNLRGMLLQSLGRREEAEQAFAETLDAARSKLGAGHPLAVNTGINLGTLLFEEGRLQDAEALFAELAEIAHEQLGPTAPETLLARNNLAVSLMQRGAADEALEILSEILDLELREHGQAHFATAVARLRLAAAFASAGDPGAAAELAEGALQHLPAVHPMHEEARSALARYRAAAAPRR